MASMSRVALRSRIAMKLYGSPNALSANTLKIRVALHEAGAAFESIPVDLSKGENRSPEFLALNPHAKIPVLVDGAFALPESGAILWYIAEKFPAAKLIPEGAHARARTHEWCDFSSSTLNSAITDHAFHTGYLPPEKRSTAVVEISEGRLVRALDVLDEVLGGREYLAGSYSIADIANAAQVNGVRLRVAHVATGRKRPRLDSWFERVTSRAAWRNAIGG